MSYWRSPSFYGLLFIGYFVALIFISVLFHIFSGDEVSPVDQWILIIGMHLLSLMAGYSFALAKLRKRIIPRGFPVILKPPNEPES